ncbi:uncharacterized protein LOC123550305 [Mercenaria mercenaria]|uniref:uncharacterized protein LOC123550305 n=1 Tax=Mercenaria mercenaria TaxID=6596 RepID=UPI00234F30A7|nr:uncharacterized protein LOC123550305 [Mercenaria mercenaria]
MDFLCKHVIEKVSLDMSNEVVKDITKAVDVLMNRFVKSMQKEFPEIQVDHVRLCGSMAEKTRLWISQNIDNALPELEFDYLAVLKTWPSCGEMRFKLSDTCTGLMSIEYDINDKESVSGQTDFLSNLVKHTFILNFITSVNRGCKKKFCPQYGASGGFTLGRTNKYSNINGCAFCTVYADSGNLRMGSSNGQKLLFIWTPKSYHRGFQMAFDKDDDYKYQLKYKAQSIEIDFHPVLILDGTRVIAAKDNSANQTMMTEEIIMMTEDIPMFLFPKKCDQHLQGKCAMMGWRISTHETELSMIKQTPSEHRLAYMILKYLVKKLVLHLDRDNSFKDISFYDLKTVLLRHIIVCQGPIKGTAYCLTDMLEMLSLCYRNLCLSHFRLSFNLLECRRKFDGTDSCSLPYSYQEIGYVLDTISNVLNIPNAHCDLNDVIRDLLAIRIIAKGLRVLVNCSTSHRIDQHDEIEKKTIILLSRSLSVFVASRRSASADETLKDTAVKYIRVFPKETLIWLETWQMIDWELVDQRKQNIDKLYRKIKIKNWYRKIKIENVNSNLNYFKNMMNESWLLEIFIKAMFRYYYYRNALVVYRPHNRYL